MVQGCAEPGSRRRFLSTLPGLAFTGTAWANHLEVSQARQLIFPRDHGAHAQYHRVVVYGLGERRRGGELGASYFLPQPGWRTGRQPERVRTQAAGIRALRGCRSRLEDYV
jgi:hypothetical protein